MDESAEMMMMPQPQPPQRFANGCRVRVRRNRDFPLFSGSDEGVIQDIDFERKICLVLFHGRQRVVQVALRHLRVLKEGVPSRALTIPGSAEDVEDPRLQRPHIVNPVPSLLRALAVADDEEHEVAGGAGEVLSPSTSPMPSPSLSYSASPLSSPTFSLRHCGNGGDAPIAGNPLCLLPTEANSSGRACCGTAIYKHQRSRPQSPQSPSSVASLNSPGFGRGHASRWPPSGSANSLASASLSPLGSPSVRVASPKCGSNGWESPPCLACGRRPVEIGSRSLSKLSLSFSDLTSSGRGSPLGTRGSPVGTFPELGEEVKHGSLPQDLIQDGSVKGESQLTHTTAACLELLEQWAARVANRPLPVDRRSLPLNIPAAVPHEREVASGAQAESWQALEEGWTKIRSEEELLGFESERAKLSSELGALLPVVQSAAPRDTSSGGRESHGKDVDRHGWR